MQIALQHLRIELQSFYLGKLYQITGRRFSDNNLKSCRRSCSRRIKKNKKELELKVVSLVYLMMQQRIQKSAFLNVRLPLLFKQAGMVIF